MLTVKALSFSLPDGRRLFQNLNFTLENKKYGLVGSNGAGKSTLARFLIGALDGSESGQLIGHAKVQYLPQWEARPAMTAGEYLVDIWENTEAEIRESLIGNIDLSLSVEHLSGGQWMRVRLCRALAQSCDLLIVDEPTNDLDREARESLYDFVQKYCGGLLMISHDRELLEHVDGIWELTNQGLSFYGGGFSTYEELKRQERERLSQEIDVARREKKKQEREHTEKIEKQAKRTRVAEKKAPDMGLPKILLGARKRQAQVSMAKINRNESERDQVKQEHFQNLLQRQKNSSDLRLDFSLDGKVKGKTIFRLEDFNYRYLGAESFLWKENLNWTFHAQDRLIIRGENGTGKSTLLKLLTKRLDLSSGEAQGDFTPITRRFVYLDQNYSELASEKNVMENLAENNRYDVTETRNKLADFGFFKEDVFKLVAVLSGGEKLRLSLAKMAFSRQPPEVWILDEPTNNLDLESLSVLEKALLEYEGSLLVTSHDEIFLERIGCGQEIKLCHHKKR